jgi:uncharacterized membrane protein (UPF0127 family)
VLVGDIPLTVWVADTPAERSQGLMGVTALPDGIDGMLFTFEEAAPRSFHMTDTLMPLEVWWFDDAGLLIGSSAMDPCPESPCPSYDSPGPVRWALETPRDQVDLEQGSALSNVESP